jgi:hypothetical protein
MRTTIELPDHLFRQAKARAAMGGRKLKDLIAEYVEQGLRLNGSTEKPARRSPSPLAREATGRTIPALTGADLYEILEAEDAKAPTGDGSPGR